MRGPGCTVERLVEALPSSGIAAAAIFAIVADLKLAFCRLAWRVVETAA